MAGKKKKGAEKCAAPSEDEMVEGSLDDLEDDFASQFRSKPFCVHLVTSNESYHLHRDVLIKHSGYFEGLLSPQSRYLEHEQDRVDLTFGKYLNGAFQMVVNYLYKGSYVEPTNTSDANQCLTHVGVFILADRFGMQDLKTMAIAQMSTKLQYLDSRSIAAVTINGMDLIYGDDLEEHQPSLETAETGHAPHSHEEGHIPQPKAESKELKPYGKGIEGPLLVEGNGKPMQADLVGIDDPRRGMQLLIAKYAASEIAELNQHDQFKNIILGGGQFPVDVLNQVGKGMFGKGW